MSLCKFGHALTEMCQCTEEEERRRSSSMVPDSIRVHVTVRVGTKTSADVMASKLTSDEINDELAKEGLRAATIVEKAVVSELVSERDTVKEDSGNDILLVALLCSIGGATATIIILAIVAAIAKCCCYRNKNAQVHNDKKVQVFMEDLERASSQGVFAPMSGRFDCVHTRPAGNDDDTIRANLTNDALVLSPTLRHVPSKSLSTTAEDIASDEVDDEEQDVLPGTVMS